MGWNHQLVMLVPCDAEVTVRILLWPVHCLGSWGFGSGCNNKEPHGQCNKGSSLVREKKSMTFHGYHQPSLVTKKYQWRIMTQIMFSNFSNYSIEPCTCFWLAMFLCYAYVLVGWGKFFGFLRFLFKERNDVFMIHGQKQFRTRLRLAKCVSMSSLNMFKIIKTFGRVKYDYSLADYRWNKQIGHDIISIYLWCMHILRNPQ